MPDDPSYPYTYAAYQIMLEYGPQAERIAQSGTGEAGFTEDVPTLSLSQADKILHGICRDANLDVRKVTKALAKKFLDNGKAVPAGTIRR